VNHIGDTKLHRFVNVSQDTKSIKIYLEIQIDR